MVNSTAVPTPPPITAPIPSTPIVQQPTTDPFTVPSININNYVPVKLKPENYLLWKTLFMPVLEYFELLGHLDGSDPCPSKLSSNGSENPDHFTWIKRDKTLMIWLNATIHESVLPYTIGCCSSKQLWDLMEKRFANLSQAHIHQLKFKLQSLKQGDSSISAYLQTIKSVVDALAAAGSPLSDADLVSHTLNGLSKDFDVFVTSIRVRAGYITSDELHNLLLSEEINIQSRHQSSSDSNDQSLSKAFAAMNFNNGNTTQDPYGGHHYSNSQSSSRGRGRGRSTPSNGGRNSNNNNNRAPRFPSQQSSYSKTFCQICQKPNHSALDCHNIMNYQFAGKIPPPKLQAMAAKFNSDSPSSSAQQQYSPFPQQHPNQQFNQQHYSPWIADSGANQHITNDVSNLSNATSYNGSGKVYVGDGSGSFGEDAFSRSF
ncbi:hypothetical protein ACHQM5_027308 [Ranunculus cassubicifolius]